MDPKPDDVTESQHRAITHLEGPLLVLAGAGSGKTRVVTRRIAWLMDQGVPPESILAITFTNKAAEEMRERVEKLVPARGAWLSTFHSMGARMLRRYADRIGYDRSFTIYSDDDQLRVVRDLLRDLGIDTTQFRPAAILGGISRLKTDLVTPDKAAGRAHDFFTEVVAKVYPAYERRLFDSSGMDFDDLLVKCLRLLDESEEARRHYQRRFSFVLVDEYQDTNRVQFLLLRTLAEPQQNLHVTGDPDQAIYRFRGADIRNILDFERDYPDAKMIRLEENFRSTGHILTGADSLIRQNRDRKAKSLVGTRGPGQKIRLRMAVDEEQEGQFVADGVLRAYESGVAYSDMAVFYRVHSLSRSLERAFIDRGIPYTIVRGTEFFRRAEVLDLIAYLKVLANPRDTETLLRVLNVPARGIGNTTRDRLVTWARAGGVPVLAAVARAAEVPDVAGRSLTALRGLAETFGELARKADGPVADLLEHVIRTIGYEAHLRKAYPDNWEERFENVEQLVSSAAEFETKHENAGLMAYLEEVSLLSDADRHDPRSARVPFMSLHTAKGLEFRNVFLVGLEDGLLPHSRSVESRADLEEERRLLFVGMTRAKEELTLSWARERFRWGQHDVTIRSKFLDEIDPEAIEVEDAPDFSAPGRVSEPHYEVDEWVQPAPEDGIRPGLQVRHSHFGVGRVTEVSGSGASARVTVDFLSHGRKKLVRMYARLTPVGDTPW